MYRTFTMLACCVLLQFGCDQGPPGGVSQPVNGIITINSVPAENIQVRFQPDPAKGGKGPGAIGTSGADGKYTLKTDDGRDGALIGWYIVSLTDLDAGRAEQGEKEKKSRVSEMYQSTTKSPLSVEVKAGSNNIPLDAK